MMGKIHIGNVEAIDSEPVDGNPYKGPSLSGEFRVAALKAFHEGRDTGSATFWCAPAMGGAYRIASPDEIDWARSGIDRR